MAEDSRRVLDSLKANSNDAKGKKTEPWRGAAGHAQQRTQLRQAHMISLSQDERAGVLLTPLLTRTVPLGSVRSAATAAKSRR